MVEQTRGPEGSRRLDDSKRSSSNRLGDVSEKKGQSASNLLNALKPRPPASGGGSGGDSGAPARETGRVGLSG